MTKVNASVIIAMASFMLSACDSCRDYSDYSCNQLEKADYNVYFYFLDRDKERYLGTSQGLLQCGEIAQQYAREKELEGAEWSYVCCLKTKNSSCAEKHR